MKATPLPYGVGAAYGCCIWVRCLYPDLKLSSFTPHHPDPNTALVVRNPHPGLTPILTLTPA